ncbi:MAG: DUF3037 domain-containing protein [Ktedonobacterales bacterium]
MPARSSFDYAIIRIVPRVERGECLNAGVILFSREAGFLAARTALDPARLAALAPELDAGAIAQIAAHVESFPRIAAGEPDAGPIARLTQAERFHWLVAPRSTMVQVSRPHAGLSDDPQAALDRLFAELMPAPQASSRKPRTSGITATARREAIAALRRALRAGRSPDEMRGDVAAALRALGAPPHNDSGSGA